MKNKNKMDYYVSLSKGGVLDERMRKLVDNYVKASKLVASNEKLKRRLERDALDEISKHEFYKRAAASQTLRLL